MFVLVRDEDVPTVAKALTALADDFGFVPLDRPAEDEDEAAFGGPMAEHPVRVSQTADQVVIEGLEPLEMGDGAEWAEQLSQACSAEVVVLEEAEVGLLVHVFDDEAEPVVSILRKGNRWDTAAIAHLANDEAGEQKLARGVTAADLTELTREVLAALGATPTAEAVTLLFGDPLGGGEDEEPGIDVDVFHANELRGRVGAPIRPVGPLFQATLRGVPEIEGLRLVFRGDARQIYALDAVEAHVRTRGAPELVLRTLEPSHVDDEAVVFLLPDAYLASQSAEMPDLDATDLFSSMQAIMSATSETMLNTLVVTPIGRGLAAGSGTLSLTVGAIGQPLEDAVDVPVFVTK